MPKDSNPQEKCRNYGNRVRKIPHLHPQPAAAAAPPEDLEPCSPTLLVSAQTPDLCTDLVPYTIPTAAECEDCKPVIRTVIQSSVRLENLKINIFVERSLDNNKAPKHYTHMVT